MNPYLRNNDLMIERDRLALELEIAKLKRELSTFPSDETNPQGARANQPIQKDLYPKPFDETAASAVISGYAPDAEPPAHPYPTGAQVLRRTAATSMGTLYDAESAGGLGPPLTVAEARAFRMDCHKQQAGVDPTEDLPITRE